MGYRRKSRELALQMLFQLDVNKDGPDWRKQFWDLHPAPMETKTFADHLVKGVLDHQPDIDRLIQKHTLHWALNRMSIIDRNILRCAIFELLMLSDIPIKVTINEAIEIAKRYSDEESSAFVNGILDHIVKEESLAKKGV
ncbi:MAG TPA: transcription antitermination factor NusB [Nitrospiria bacterium]|nr:transcription antitermination factor NusB [Nitrospiria bacterium]